MTTTRPTDKNIDAQLRDSKGKLVSNKPSLTRVIHEALDDAVRAIRTQHPELPQVVIVVGTPAKAGRSVVHGVFSSERWQQGKAHVHEIRMSGESFRRGPEATLGTLIHECTHALAAKRDIKDTSRNGRYHNKRFKKLAEEMGIAVSDEDKSIGWSLTTLPDDTKRLYKRELSELSKALKGYRIPPDEMPTKPKTTIKIECGCRSVTVPISFYDKGLLTCDECETAFLPIGATREDDDE